MDNRPNGVKSEGQYSLLLHTTAAVVAAPFLRLFLDALPRHMGARDDDDDSSIRLSLTPNARPVLIPLQIRP